MADDSNVGEDVIAYAMKEMNELERREAEAKDVLKNRKADVKDALKRYETYGIDKASFLEARRIQREGAEEYRQCMAGIGRILRAVKDPQGLLFEDFDDPNRATVEMRAEWEGYSAALNNLTISHCPYDPGEPGRKPWEKGFLEGQKVCAAGLAAITLAEEQSEDDGDDEGDDGSEEPDPAPVPNDPLPDDWAPGTAAFDEANDPALVP